MNRAIVARVLVPLCAGLALAACATTARRNASPTALPAASGEDRPLAISTEPWTFESKDGQLIHTPSYRVYTTVTKAQLASRLPTFLEHCLINYTTALGDLPRPEGRMDTFVLANRPQWERQTQRVMGDQADVYLKIQRGGFSAGGRAVLYDIGPRDTFAITAHEGWHQYSQTTFHAPMPVAIEEGLATYMEGFRWDPDNPDRPRFMAWANFERFEQLRGDVAARRLVPLARLQQSTPQDIIAEDPDAALTYYAQVWALIHFLHEGDGGRYRAGLESMLRDAASGDLLAKVRARYGSRATATLASKRVGVDVIGLYCGSSAEDLDPAYRAFIDRIVRVGSRQRIASGQSPIPD